MIPGSNLLEDALTVIESQDFQWLQFLGRDTNSIGIDNANYAPAVPLEGSVQPVPRSLFQALGLDWKKNHITIYNFENITGIQRDSSGDRVIFGGKTYQALSENDWSQIDGWTGTLFAEVRN